MGSVDLEVGVRGERGVGFWSLGWSRGDGSGEVAEWERMSNGRTVRG